MARCGDSPSRWALSTRRALSRASPSRAPPNSWSAQGRRVEPVADPERRHARRGRLESVAPRRLQHIDVHALARFRGRVRPVLAPAPAGLTHADPVRRPQARPRLAGLVDERLQQPGPIAVEALAVVADRPGGPAQHMGGQVAARDAGAHQQPAQAQHAVQVGASARVVPADPGVAVPQAPRTRGEPHPAQPTVRRAYQITQLRADERSGAARVFMRHQRVPDSALPVGLHPYQRQVPDLADRGRHVNRRSHRLRKHTRPPHTAAGRPVPRQRNVARRLEVGQRRRAARALPPAAAIAEIERFTDAVGDLPEPVNALRCRPVQHLAQPGEVAPQAAPDLTLNLHACHRSEVAA